MPTSFTSSYLLPAIVLNPLVVLHGFNTFTSHFIPSAMSTIASHSPHKFFEALGPPGNHAPYLDMHDDDGLCWRYTMVMVALQVLAYGKVCDNREVRKERREKKRLERGQASEVQEVQVESVLVGKKMEKMEKEEHASAPSTPLLAASLTSTETHGSDSDFTELTDTSEEETII